MNITVDTSEYRQWLKNLEKAKDNLNDEMFKNLLLRLAEEILAKTKKRTPVRTGNLRNSWQLGRIMTYGNIIGIEIINDAYHEGSYYELLYGKENTGNYASQIEYGFNFPDGRHYEGRFMLTISMNEVRARIPREFNAAFTRWARAKGI